MNENKDDNTSLQLKSIAKSLDLLAFLKQVDFFYSLEERKEMLQNFRKLCDEDQVAFDALTAAGKAIPGEDVGYERRVEKYGKTETDAQLAPYMEVLAKRRETLKAITQFEAQHPVARRLTSLAPKK